MFHAIKIEPSFFETEIIGARSCEVEKGECKFTVGDYIALNEWNGKRYTGRGALYKITYIFDNSKYCKEGHVILCLEPCTISWWKCMRF